MLKTKPQYIYLSIGILLWLMLLTVINNHVFEDSSLYGFIINHTINAIILTGFLLCVLMFFKLTIDNYESEGFNELLWKAIVTGTISAIILFANGAINEFLDYQFPQNELFINNFLYCITIAIVCVFVSNTFYIFKKLLLYYKTKEVNNLWNVFEYLLLFTLIFNFLKVKNDDIIFTLSFVPVFAIGVILSLNLKWIAYLDFKQKLKNLTYLVVILMFCLYFVYFLFNQSKIFTLHIDLANNLFIVSLMGFIVLYCTFSILVLIFNLPTSSVFEQKFDEALNLQKLSNSIHMGKTEQEVFEILIDSCCDTLFASGAGLEIFDQGDSPKQIIYRGLDKDTFYMLKTFLRKNSIRYSDLQTVAPDLKKLKFYDEVEELRYESALIIPLISHGEKIGAIYLYSEVKNAFEKGLLDIANTYVNQASTAITNFRLIHEAVQTAKYREELEIAKRVQSDLLPKSEINYNGIQIVSFAESASDVGGDYFDYYPYSDGKVAIVIGDVSGRGTSAAFHMAQLKGIFQSLIQLEQDTSRFIELANNAVSRCMRKSSFVTLTILVIDRQNYTFETSRAGHCPTIYINAETGKAKILEQEGIGLGIIRSEKYLENIHSYSFDYRPGDMLFLYTDGIMEAKNIDNVEFGVQRMADFMANHYKLHISEIKTKFTEYLHAFCTKGEIIDDHTFMIVRLS
ncbi:MAG: GAF domain-containing SpoIIE family protein phosphatase [Cytophagales bacterium]|nr:GAF domain-containing SpoIIE family protein phosphatase [Cytophagales bacterium]